MCSEGAILRREGVYANPDEGLEASARRDSAGRCGPIMALALHCVSMGHVLPMLTRVERSDRGRATPRPIPTTKRHMRSFAALHILDTCGPTSPLSDAVAALGRQAERQGR